MNLADNLYEGRNSKKTREGLPKITQETIDQVKKELYEDVKNGLCIQPRIEELAKQLEAENPTLLCYIQEAVNPYPPDLQGLTFARLILFYDLMKKQLINDNLSVWKKVYEFWEQAEG